MTSKTPLALAIASIVLLASGVGSAKNVEVEASLATIVPAGSPYRTALKRLGYADEGLNNGYEGEAAAQFAIGYHDLVSIGPVARLGFNRMKSRYEDLAVISADYGSLGIREEFIVFWYPRFFLWADQSFGIGSIGPSGSRRAYATFAGRGGLGLRVFNDSIGVRFRIGYSFSPTLVRVTDPTGGYDFGGFVFSIDGVIRVAH